MSDPTATSDPIPTPPERPVEEMSASELRLERERCTLDRERLSLERERMETERLRLERERQLYASGSERLHVGIGILALCVAVFLALGLLLGYNAGYDTSPPPQKVLVGRKFMELLDRTKLPPPPPPASSAPVWARIRARSGEDAAFGNLVIVR